MLLSELQGNHGTHEPTKGLQIIPLRGDDRDSANAG